jgi:tetratricopeptide (TPR) repeat protein
MAPEPPVLSARLDEIGPLNAWREVEWFPVRRHFGITAFGVNAYAVENAGETVIVAHDEQGGNAAGHEELYVVLAGRATFTIAGEELDAPAGTCVFVRDPAAERAAVAAEPATRILAVGARPGEPYRPGAWESNAAIRYHHGRQEYEAALEIAREAIDGQPDNARLLYNLACVECRTGDRESALEHLRSATGLEPRLAETAAGDEDLEELRSDPRFPA